MTELPPCPDSPNCVSSDADPEDAEHWIAPLQLAVGAERAWPVVVRTVEETARTRIVERGETRMRAEVTSRFFRFVDDLELRLHPGEGVIAVRSSSRVGYSDLGVNRRRVEGLRERLRGAGVVR